MSLHLDYGIPCYCVQRMLHSHRSVFENGANLKRLNAIGIGPHGSDLFYGNATDFQDLGKFSILYD